MNTKISKFGKPDKTCHGRHVLSQYLDMRRGQLIFSTFNFSHPHPPSYMLPHSFCLKFDPTFLSSSMEESFFLFQVLVVITDGQQTPRGGQSATVSQLATNLKNKGVVIISVGIGSGVSSTQLEEIAQGVANNVIEIDDFSLLKNKTDTLIERSCRGISTLSPSIVIRAREFYENIDHSICINK